MEVKVVVSVEVEGDPQYHHGEERLEQEAVAAVRDCLLKEKTIMVLDVSVLGFEHCEWMRELGMPVECPSVPEGIDIFEDGSWCVPSGITAERVAGGPDLLSLLNYIRRRSDG